jgi:nucleotide-binding universal stress UspA family protein
LQSIALGPDEFGGRTPRLLAPYSGSSTAGAGLDLAANLGVALSAEVWVLYVRTWDPLPGGGRVFFETAGEAGRTAQAAVSHLRRRGASASAVVRDAYRAHISDVILAESETLNASYIVLGTRVRRALTSALLGSTSLVVARRSSRPVLLIKPAAQRHTWGSEHLPRGTDR